MKLDIKVFLWTLAVCGALVIVGIYGAATGRWVEFWGVIPCV